MTYFTAKRYEDEKKNLYLAMNMQYLYNRLVYIQQERTYTKSTSNSVVVHK